LATGDTAALIGQALVTLTRLPGLQAEQLSRAWPVAATGSDHALPLPDVDRMREALGAMVAADYADVDTAGVCPRYFVTDAGLSYLASTRGVSEQRIRRALGADHERLATARLARAVLYDAYAALFRGVATVDVIYALAPMRFQHAICWQHVRFHHAGHCYTLYIDRGADALWSWRATYRAMQRRHLKSARNIVLVLCARDARALAHLLLARVCAPALAVAASGARTRLLASGLLDTAAGTDVGHTRFWAFDHDRVIPVDPFAGAVSSDSARCDLDARHVARWIDLPGGRARRRTVVRGVATSDLTRLEAVSRSLDEPARAVLGAICRNPCAPEMLIAARVCASVGASITRLIERGLVVRTETAVTWRTAPLDSLRASPLGALLYMRENLLGPGWLKRQTFFQANHLARRAHTFLTYEFFVKLGAHCDKRSRAMRALDVKPGELNDAGTLPYYALIAHASEFFASDGYLDDGEVRHFRPDGFGALRCGKAVTRFWLEIDGTPDAPRGASVSTWAERIRRWYAYVALGRWRLSYASLPRLLIMTTNPGACARIAEINMGIARGLARSPLDIRYTGSEALEKNGPFARIWFDCARPGHERVFAFDNIAPRRV
jgi:hypothetical protein